MNVVLYGATGKTGSRILNELLSRGHQVKAIVRNPAKLPQRPGLTVEAGDLTDTDGIIRAVKGADIVISAYAPPMDAVEELVAVTKHLADAVKAAAAPRLLVVGGAGTLEVTPGVQLVDTPSFPEAWRPIALAHRGALQVLKSSDTNWTYLSPAALLEPGERTGKFRLGKDNLIADGYGNSRISMEDYAIALVDEVEKPEHLCQRFSVGY